MIILKRHPNRKIYSPKNNKPNQVGYVNMSDIKDMIRNGKTITVLDTAGKNVTNAVLLEVIKKAGLNNEELHNIIG